MSQQEMNFEELGHAESEFAYRGDEVMNHYNDAEGQKIRLPEEPAGPTTTQRLALAAISLSLLTVVTLGTMILLAHAVGPVAPHPVGFMHPGMMTDDGAQFQGVYQMHHRGFMFIAAQQAPADGNGLSPFFFIPLFVFFAAVMGINILFSRKK